MSFSVSHQVRSSSVHDEPPQKEADSFGQLKDQKLSLRSWVSFPRLWSDDERVNTEIDSLKTKIKALNDRLATARQEPASASTETNYKVPNIAKIKKTFDSTRKATTPEGVSLIVSKGVASADNFEQIYQSISEQNLKMGALLSDFERDKSRLILQLRELRDTANLSQQLNEQLHNQERRIKELIAEKDELEHRLSSLDREKEFQQQSHVSDWEHLNEQVHDQELRIKQLMAEKDELERRLSPLRIEKEFLQKSLLAEREHLNERIHAQELRIEELSHQMDPPGSAEPRQGNTPPPSQTLVNQTIDPQCDNASIDEDQNSSRESGTLCDQTPNVNGISALPSAEDLPVDDSWSPDELPKIPSDTLQTLQKQHNDDQKTLACLQELLLNKEREIRILKSENHRLLSLRRAK